MSSFSGGVVKVKVTKDRAFLGGKAITVAKGELLGEEDVAVAKHLLLGPNRTMFRFSGRFCTPQSVLCDFAHLHHTGQASTQTKSVIFAVLLRPPDLPLGWYAGCVTRQSYEPTKSDHARWE